LAEAVVARVSAQGLPRGGRLRARRSALVAAVVAALLSGLAVEPVRAQLADWFGFAGVRVHRDPSAVPPSPSPSSSSPSGSPSAGSVSLERARALVRFRVRVPAALGPPRTVQVSADRRVVSMTWATPMGPVRLDQFDGRLDYAFAKSAPDVTWLQVKGEPALWFDEPHAVAVVAGESSRTSPPRLAARTLIWESAGVTMRLEGDLTQERALAVAASVPA
jgi:hypothetical protein